MAIAGIILGVLSLLLFLVVMLIFLLSPDMVIQPPKPLSQLTLCKDHPQLRRPGAGPWRGRWRLSRLGTAVLFLLTRPATPFTRGARCAT